VPTGPFVKQFTFAHSELTPTTIGHFGPNRWMIAL
jgi:hypothetical protein